MLDLGAGPGTASWAGTEIFPELRELHLVEREKVAIEAGKDLSAHSMHEAWRGASWNEASLESLSEFPQVDLAVLSYAVAELPKDVVHALLQRLWERNIALVAVIEPGTPQGFARIRALRERAIEQGAMIVAPCPHGFACPMPVNDWCHFSTRIERTRLHRQLKEGSLGYEDEKYSYVVYGQFATLAPMRGRVLRHPQKGSGFVKLSICEADGAIREETITRSNKDQYRLARDAEWGSSLA
jgi:ribosomal protein RSM22 (predicted rRNA methylase)